MANINKIRLSGTTYNIEDENASKTVELTQAQYDALATKDPNTYYVITDATAVDLANYYTKAQTDTALATKQATLVSGTNIKTINNESILGSGNIEIQGGGATYTAGTNISIDTANTINCTLPLKVGIGYNSICGGDLNNNSCYSQYGFAYGDNADCGSSGSYCMAFGSNVYANAHTAFITGYENTGTNVSQAVFGRYSVNNKANDTWGDNGNTLFSVGNGTSNSARHNAFEIRQNGDIYVNDGTNDVKLQDTITATASNTTALGGLKLVSLTQAQYDALSTKDASTIYFING